MSRVTRHGENIAASIQGEDPYGYKSVLTTADIWNIVDNIHSNVLFNVEGEEKELTQDDLNVLNMLSRWMDELQDLDSDLPL